MGNGSPPTVTDLPQISPKRVPWRRVRRLQLSSRQPRLKTSICSSPSHKIITTHKTPEPCTLPPRPAPPRPPRPMTSLQNLRPTVILSPIAIPATAYLPFSSPSRNSGKAVSFSDDVFAALPGCFGQHHSYAHTEAQNVISQHVQEEFNTDTLYSSKPTKSPTRVQIGHAYIQQRDGNSSPSEIVPSTYASSSCLGTSLTSYCREQKPLEFALPTSAISSRDLTEEDTPRSEQTPGNKRLTLLRVWISRYRRTLWMLGTIFGVLVASSAIIAAIIWKLTTCEFIYTCALWFSLSFCVPTRNIGLGRQANERGCGSWLRSEVLGISNVECPG